MRFQTSKTYSDRKSKSEYVYDKFANILTGNILDVGADECHLKNLLGDNASYTGIGIGGNPDIEVNLERELIPFEDSHFDCVLCLDVLEHLDNIHAVFDELCRVSRKYVIISLPNSYRDFFGMLFGKASEKAINFKYYGLPVDRPEDRHKWFFSNSDARAFIEGRAEHNGMKIIQMDSEGQGPAPSYASAAKRAGLKAAALFMPVKAEDLYYKTLWAVLEKTDNGK